LPSFSFPSKKQKGAKVILASWNWDFLGLDLREIMEDAAVAEVVLKLFELGAIKLG